LVADLLYLLGALEGALKPVILQCRTPHETNPKGHWGPHYFFIQSLFLLPPCTQSGHTQPPHPLMIKVGLSEGVSGRASLISAMFTKTD
jgi:hypothetical protein